MVHFAKLKFLMLVLVSLKSVTGGYNFHYKNGDECRYNSCKDYDPKKLNIHIVPHTHNDVAWTKTFDGYYREDVRHILNSVVKELWNNSKRRFVYVETAFFWRWWIQQPSEVRARVQALVHLGQLQFAGGAWSMNDEATTHYQSIIDQFTFGLSKLDEAFGPCARPLVGWQIDPFGHSREFASLLAAMGYDALFIDRIDADDKKRRKTYTEMEMIWRGDDNLGSSSDIFTSVLSNGYAIPHQYRFDLFEYKGSNNRSFDNVLRNFHNFVQKQAKYFRTNNVLIPMGGDFGYQSAHFSFASLDNLIKYFNMRSKKTKAFYSTPNCYFKAVYDAHPTLPTKRDDFFPYASSPNVYWTGFYTSRPSIKFLERDTNRYFQMVKQLQVLAELSEKNLLTVERFKNAMGLMQHHDAIAGTLQDHVARDLRRILDKALENALDIANQAFNKYLKSQPQLFFTRCRLNESSCLISEQSNQFIISVYNPLGWGVIEPINIPVTPGSYEVYNHTGQKVQTQLVEIAPQIIALPSRKSEARHELYFFAELPPLSFVTFYIRRLEPVSAYDHDGKDETNFVKKRKRDSGSDELILKNEFLKLKFKDNGEVYEVSKFGNWTRPMEFFMKYYYYPTSNSQKAAKPGAYVFSGGQPREMFLNFSAKIQGPIVQEIRTSTTAIHNTMKLYKDLNYLENEWLVGPINVTDGIGKQYIIRYMSSLLTKGVFYTDSNGRQMIKRKIKRDNEIDSEATDLAAMNYYPVANRIYVQDGVHRINVMTDRAQGGTSLDSGEVELMIHRRLLYDDGWGVDEPLNETEDGVGLVVRGRHRIFFSDTQNKTQRIEDKKQVIKFHLQPIVLFADAYEISLEQWLRLNKSYSWINKELPPAVHLLTLEPMENRMLLLRLENILERKDQKNATTVVNLKNLFKNLSVESFKEVKLGANVEVKRDMRKNFGMSVVLEAREIRTFIIDY